MIGASVRRDLILLGGGHAHALALRMLAMRPPEGTRISLVSDTGFAPYSGMLPGLVAGHYGYRQTHIDLRRFCAARGIRFIESAATGVDLGERRLLLHGRPPLEYDILSINIGAQPELDSVPGACEHAVPVKPVSRFYRRWQSLEQRLSRGRTDKGIVLVGGGAASVELALAMRYRLGDQCRISLISGDVLLRGYNARARSSVRRRLKASGIEVLERCRVTRVEAGCLEHSCGGTVHFDELVWCTGVVPVGWLKESGLPCDEQGFIRVDDNLQVAGNPGVFAVGDCAVQQQHPRPRAGVFAVRQSPVLAHNLGAILAGDSLRPYRPQRRFLSLLSLGDRLAVADRGPFSATGSWVWRWKNRIDRRFMAQFCETPPPMVAKLATPETMHCGGCGAKLPASILREVLARLAREQPRAVDNQNLQEDAAVIPWPSDAPLVQSVDTLRQIVDEPWLMGRITALHALSDLYAMGVRPKSAQVHVCLPYASPEVQRRELYQIMSGLVREFDLAGARLVGGHSMEGEELAVGVTVNGAADSSVFTKHGAREGDRLVLSKPLGIGVIFAASMSGIAPGDVVAAALDSMLRSNRDAAELGRALGASACTDVTGFGLIGHLLEMLADGGLTANLLRREIPCLPGARELVDSGIHSTLYASNVGSLPEELAALAEKEPLLCDPQTSGGLLLAIPPDRAERLVDALAERGHEAAVIGELRADQNAPAVTLDH